LGAGTRTGHWLAGMGHSRSRRGGDGELGVAANGNGGRAVNIDSAVPNSFGKVEANTEVKKNGDSGFDIVKRIENVVVKTMSATRAQKLM
jgi:hypothetical protein